MRFHTSLPVINIKDTVAFYRVLFDEPPVKTKSDYAKFLPADADLNISFHHSPDRAKEMRSLHLGFELTDQSGLDNTYQRLKEAGLVSGTRDTTVCCYANQDKFQVTDPNGYEWELYYLLDDTEESISSDTKCCTSPTDTTTSSCC
ncbi:MAG: hypothetical protein COB20_07065 [SAR86 cluster bacterium]|uniref:VOC domain-containing protein n=1 Tax=SAR86 cluster bacterium TaxID=2030880 RepID=A0A2A4X5E8_9GAMM|nr:MAG: hypothetical protein COB20_07065 [SAR86 cluster bacterium]